MLGDLQLTLDFCTRKASPGKPELFRGLKCIVELRRKFKGIVFFHHAGRGNNQLADWLTCVPKELQRSVAVERKLPSDLTLFVGLVWDTKHSSEHEQGC